jgi:hypothetical protein
VEVGKRKCYKYSELYLAALNVKNAYLEDVENDLQELKMKQWRQRQIIRKNGHFVVKEGDVFRDVSNYITKFLSIFREQFSSEECKS